MADTSSATPGVVPQTILVYDSASASMRSIARHLSEFEAQIIETSDRGEAERIAAAEIPDLVVLGLQPPLDTDLALCRRIRSHAATATVPVLALVDDIGLDVRLSILEHGGTDFLARPFVAKEFRAKARTYLDLSRMQRQVVLAEKRRAISSLVRGLAHQFNNILCGLSGTAQLLEARVPPGSDLQRQAQSILRNTHRAATLSRQLITFAQMKRESLESVASPIATLELAWETLEATLDGRHQIRIESGVPRDFSIEFNSVDLQAVFIQLLTNATNAMPHGGEVHVLFSERGEGLVAEIRDQGRGMSREVLDHVFDPFYSSDASTPGLGLSMVRNLVEHFGGEIGIDSHEGRGTRVVLRLPRAEPRPA